MKTFLLIPHCIQHEHIISWNVRFLGKLLDALDIYFCFCCTTDALITIMIIVCNFPGRNASCNGITSVTAVTTIFLLLQKRLQMHHLMSLEEECPDVRESSQNYYSPMAVFQIPLTRYTTYLLSAFAEDNSAICRPNVQRQLSSVRLI